MDKAVGKMVQQVMGSGEKKAPVKSIKLKVKFGKDKDKDDKKKKVKNTHSEYAEPKMKGHIYN